jgi:RNA polymerase sigma-70 factor (ECF subfamily)
LFAVIRNSSGSAVALALKTLCAFNVTEISRGFLTSEAAIAKRLTRAKQKIQEAHIPFEIPVGDELARRLESVLQSLYLLFTRATRLPVATSWFGVELCDEAIRLDGIVGTTSCWKPAKDVMRCLALMLLNARAHRRVKTIKATCFDSTNRTRRVGIRR